MTWLQHNAGTVAEAAWAHLWLALPAIALSFLLALPVAWVANRLRWSRFTLLLVTGLLYAIPSLPLFIMLPMVTGAPVRSPVNVVAALTAYGLSLMVRSAADALDAVPEATLLSATALGYSGLRRFFTVQLPLGAPALLAGLRVVSVSTVSLVTVSGVLGVPSLGLLFTDGFQRGIVAEVIAGIIATVALAMLVDLALVSLGRLLLPWQRSGRPGTAGVV
ncbi:MAG: ABC transporter permease subunit [Actinomycetia bacterium]|nr:ABC transporter permease subunit [Actinomycetes bacterium]